MKKILFTIIAASLLLTACNSEKNNSLNNEKHIVFTDTSALRLSNTATDNAASAEKLVPAANQDNVKPKVVTVTKYVTVENKQRAPVKQNNDNTQVNEPANNTSSTNASSGAGASNNGEVATSNEPVVKKKEGWSDAAKGATIGGVGGAVAGAVISKKKGKGAVIGGVIGAAGGYILGRKADKKSGRAN